HRAGEQACLAHVADGGRVAVKGQAIHPVRLAGRRRRPISADDPGSTFRRKRFEEPCTSSHAPPRAVRYSLPAPGETHGADVTTTGGERCGQTRPAPPLPK